MTDMIDMADEPLALRARAGCRSAFDALARRYQGRLLAYLRRRATTGAEAEDLLQETLLRAFRHLSSYHAERPFRAWLFTIGHRVAISHRRRLPMTLSLDRASAHPAGDATAADTLERRETSERIWRIAQRELSARQFTVTWMHYVEEVPLTDIGAAMGLTDGATRAVLFRARKRLEKHLRDDGVMFAGVTPAVAGVA